METIQQGVLIDSLISIASQNQDFAIFSLLKPKIYIDGDQWCVLYGDNICDGICGFGSSPIEAICDFNQQWYKKLEPSGAKCADK